MQQGSALFFAGDCVHAQQAFAQALAIDPTLIDANINAGIVALWQSRRGGQQTATA